MIAILVDHNIGGQADLLMSVIEAEGWIEPFQLQVFHLAEVGLPENAKDRELWRFAQTHRMFLLTGNRNRKGEDSLGQTISEENTLTSLPVITIGNTDRVEEKGYREACVARLLEIVLYPEDSLGTGRLFIP